VDIVPREPAVTAPVRVPVYDMDLLRAVAVRGRSTSTLEVLSYGLLARSVFHDMRVMASDNDEVRVAAARFERARVAQVVTLHDAVFGGPGSDRTDAIIADLDDAFAAYAARSDAPVEPRDFAWYVATTPERATTMRTLLGVREVFAGLRDMGLTDVEYAQTRDRLLARLVRDGSTYSPALLDGIIEVAGTPAMATSR
jgi:hypothetical protein